MTSIAEKDIRHSHMPDYSVRLDDSDHVLFQSRGSIPTSLTAPPTVAVGTLDAETYHDARIVAPGWDVYYLEREWRDWITERPRDPDAAFLGFCRKWYDRRGVPR